MAIQSLTDLKALINSKIQDNTTNDISGSDVQTALINAIDTLDSLEGFINVHKANGQTTITAYGSKALARAAVPDDCKKEGVVIAYKISTGWLIEQNLDATAGTWGDDASWQTIGPVSVSQNTLKIGGDSVLHIQDYNGPIMLVGQGQTPVFSNPIVLESGQRYRLILPTEKWDTSSVASYSVIIALRKYNDDGTTADKFHILNSDLSFTRLFDFVADDDCYYRLIYRGDNNINSIFSIIPCGYIENERFARFQIKGYDNEAVRTRIYLNPGRYYTIRIDKSKWTDNNVHPSNAIFVFAKIKNGGGTDILRVNDVDILANDYRVFAEEGIDYYQILTRADVGSDIIIQIYDSTITDDNISDIIGYGGNSIILSRNNGWISSENKCVFSGIAKHAVIPVNGGEPILVQAGTKTGIIAYLSSYQEPLMDGVNYDLVPNTSRIAIPTGTQLITQIPTGTKYLFVGLIADDGNHTPLSVIINGYDYTQKITDVITSIIDKQILPYSYIGDNIANYLPKLGYKPLYSLKYSSESTFGASDLQACAVYDDILFQFTAQNNGANDGGVEIVDLVKGITIQYINLGNNPNYHNSNATFGVEKYEENDRFPLLYVSQNYASNNYYKILVYRIVETGIELTPYNLSLVQTINMPSLSDMGNILYPHAVVDAQNGYIWIEGYSSDQNNNVFNKYRLPLLAEGDCDLGNNILKTFSISRVGDSTDQSFIVYNNTIFQITGYNNNPKLKVISIEQEKLVSLVELWKVGLAVEPEGISIYKGNVIITFINSRIYTMLF